MIACTVESIVSPLALFLLAACLLVPSTGHGAVSIPVGGTTVEVSAKPGANYAHADFRVWLPDGADPIAAVIVMVPGSNGDGRSQVTDQAWQALAKRRHCALIGCSFADQEPRSVIEQYADAARGSGQALLDAIATVAARSARTGLATAPLLLWGFSAGGQFNYEFNAWKPERVAAFIANKGGIYYSALVPQAARAVPGILFTGASDMPSRIQILNGLFALNRRFGALWALVEEPRIGHDVGRSEDLARIFFDEILEQRRTAPGGAVRLTIASGYFGDLATKTVKMAAAGDEISAAWLPSLRCAQAWQAVMTGAPIPP